MSFEIKGQEWVNFDEVREQLGRPDLTDEELREMCREAGIDMKALHEVSPGSVIETDVIEQGPPSNF